MTKDKEKIINDLSEEDTSGKNELEEITDSFLDGFKDQADRVNEMIQDAAKTVGDFADTQLKNAKSIFEKTNSTIDEAIKKNRLDRYNPVFSESVNNRSINYPAIINVIDKKDDKRAKVKECEGALGYQQTINNTNLLDIYESNAAEFNLDFYPSVSQSIYYVHPFKKNTYIEISEYFSYLKEARVTELKNIAQSLGATYFKVEIMEEMHIENISKANGKAKFGFGRNRVGVDVNAEVSQKKYESVGIAAESYYVGKKPERPELKFWKNNEAIKNMIEQRLSEDNPLVEETFRLDYNAMSGIKEKEAAKIDGVLKVLKFNGAGSVLKQAKDESRKKFSYKIKF